MNQLKFGAILSYTTIILNTMVGLLYTPFMLRMMGQNEFGLYSLSSSIISYLTILDLGFGNAIIRYTSKFRAEGKTDEQYNMFGMFLFLYICIGVIAVIAGLSLLFNTNEMFGQTMTAEELHKVKVMMLLLTFNLAYTFPMSIWGAIITAYEKFVFQKAINILRILSNTTIMIILLNLGYKSVALVIVITSFNVISLLLNMLYCKYKLKIKIFFKSFNWSFLKEITNYSLWIFLNAIVDRIYWGTGQFVLGIYTGAKAIAVYGVAIQLQGMYDSFSNAISSVFFPRVTKLVVNNNKDEISSLFIRIGRIQFYVMGLILSGFIVFGKTFVLFWAGEDYKDAYYICLLIFIPLTIPLIQNLGIYIMQAYKKVQFRAILYVVIAFFSLFLSVLLAKKYNGLGCAIATSLGLTIGHVIIMNIYYNKVIGLNIKEFWKQIYKIAIIPISLTISFLLLSNFISFSNIPKYIGMILLYILMYCWLIWSFSFNNYEKGLIKTLIKKK